MMDLSSTLTSMITATEDDDDEEQEGALSQEEIEIMGSRAGWTGRSEREAGTRYQRSRMEIQALLKSLRHLQPRLSTSPALCR